MEGWRLKSRQQYNVYLKKWMQFCLLKKWKPEDRNDILALNFLLKLFKDNYSYSAINTARCALSALFHDPSFGNSTLTTRFMRAVYNLRPNLPKYKDTWSVTTVLQYLEKLSPARFLNLQQLAQKLATLLALVTGQRIQTIHSFNIEHCDIQKEAITFHIQTLLKHTKPGNSSSNCFCIKAYNNNKKICPVFLLKYYMKRTKKLRHDGQLFINHQMPHKAISKDTISRYVKTTLSKAGINTTKYSTHSTRAASTSAAAKASVDITTIMKAASWNNSSTFTKFYKRDTNITKSYSNSILQQI